MSVLGKPQSQLKLWNEEELWATFKPTVMAACFKYSDSCIFQKFTLKEKSKESSISVIFECKYSNACIIPHWSKCICGRGKSLLAGAKADLLGGGLSTKCSPPPPKVSSTFPSPRTCKLPSKERQFFWRVVIIFLGTIQFQLKFN